SLLTFNRLQMALVVMGICWIAIASAEAFHFSRLAWQKVATLPGMGLLMGNGNEDSTAPLPITKTPLQKGDTVAGYLVTSGFGSRVPPCAGCSSNHLGVDLGTPIGTPVYAPYAAIVECKGGPSNPAGNYAVLKPKEGKAPEFLYLHLDTCTAGEAKPGQQVATSGNTGNGTGAHLDVRQIEAGEYTNPTREWVERIITGKVGAMKSGPSDAADFIAQFEGFHNTPYWDYQQYTWGYGTRAPGPTGYISQEQAQAELNQRIAQDNATLERLVKVSLTPSQCTALLSFQFNTGALEGSQLIAKLNAGDVAGAAAEFDRWILAGGQPLEGLRRRRAAEKELFLGP
ncbi:MAG TPA: glycoside hydrolase family protein, partial [Trichocoleus sp.]